MLFTPDYQALQKKFHEARPDYGCGGNKHVDFVQHLSEQIQSRDILDYGCGKAYLQKGLPFPIQNYDPCTVEYNVVPRPADILVCTDVLEHIEPELLDDVLAHIAGLTKQVAFLNVATRPAVKFLPDGRNAHLIQESPSWWLKRLLAHMDLTSFQVGKGEFNALMVPPMPVELEFEE